MTSKRSRLHAPPGRTNFVSTRCLPIAGAIAPLRSAKFVLSYTSPLPYNRVVPAFYGGRKNPMTLDDLDARAFKRLSRSDDGGMVQ